MRASIRLTDIRTTFGYCGKDVRAVGRPAVCQTAKVVEMLRREA